MSKDNDKLIDVKKDLPSRSFLLSFQSSGYRNPLPYSCEYP